MNAEQIDRLREIKDTIEGLLDEARDILRQDRHAWESARLYWWAHIRTALDRDSDYLGGSMLTMQDTIDQLSGEEDEDEEDDE